MLQAKLTVPFKIFANILIAQTIQKRHRGPHYASWLEILNSFWTTIKHWTSQHQTRQLSKQTGEFAVNFARRLLRWVSTPCTLRLLPWLLLAFPFPWHRSPSEMDLAIFVLGSWCSRWTYPIHSRCAKSGFCECISSRITTVIHIVSDHQINYNCFNEPFAVSPSKSLHLDMHGLILKQAYDYWQDQPGENVLATQYLEGLSRWDQFTLLLLNLLCVTTLRYVCSVPEVSAFFVVDNSLLHIVCVE